MTTHPKQAKLVPDDGTEVVPIPQRRSFTAAYKAQIVAECDAAAKEGSGTVGAILRREGLYSSLLAQWRAAIKAGLQPKKTGRKKKNEADKQAQREMERLRRHNEEMADKLRRAELIIEAKKNSRSCC